MRSCNKVTTALTGSLMRLCHTIPGSIRTGESYFQGKERLVNSVILSRGLAQLFVTLTFNDTWAEFEHILRNASSRFPSDNPWALSTITREFWIWKTNSWNTRQHVLESCWSLSNGLNSNCEERSIHTVYSGVRKGLRCLRHLMSVHFQFTFCPLLNSIFGRGSRRHDHHRCLCIIVWTVLEWQSDQTMLGIPSVRLQLISHVNV
jgi:hypothetical protein